MSTWPTSLGNPQFSGYELETVDQTVRTDMDGGAARVRRRSTATPDHVPLRFIFNESQMATFRAFWESDFMYGAAWVNMPVKTGRVSGLSVKECRPLKGTFKAPLVGNKTWAVEFQVEVRNA